MRYRDHLIMEIGQDPRDCAASRAAEYFAEYVNLFPDLIDKDGYFYDDPVAGFISAIRGQLLNATEDLDTIGEIGPEGELYVHALVPALCVVLSPHSRWIASPEVADGDWQDRAKQVILAELKDVCHEFSATAPNWEQIHYRRMTKRVISRAAMYADPVRLAIRHARWALEDGTEPWEGDPPLAADQMLLAARYPQPGAQPYGVSNYGAEQWCTAWMRHWGIRDAVVTQATGDGGIDIESSTHIAQVKHDQGTVGIAEIRSFAGAAAGDPQRRATLFFTSGRYPASAIEFAQRVGMALFRYDIARGSVEGQNDLGQEIAQGLLKS